MIKRRAFLPCFGDGCHKAGPPFHVMNTKITPIQPTTALSKASAENERVRKLLFSARPAIKGKSVPLDEEKEKARRKAQDEYIDRLDKQFVWR